MGFLKKSVVEFVEELLVVLGGDLHIEEGTNDLRLEVEDVVDEPVKEVVAVIDIADTVGPKLIIKWIRTGNGGGMNHHVFGAHAFDGFPCVLVHRVVRVGVVAGGKGGIHGHAECVQVRVDVQAVHDVFRVGIANVGRVAVVGVRVPPLGQVTDPVSDICRVFMDVRVAFDGEGSGGVGSLGGERAQQHLKLEGFSSHSLEI